MVLSILNDLLQGMTCGVGYLSILNDLLQWSTLLEAKIEAQPKPSSKRIENVSLASFFGRLWGGVHDPVHLKQPFTMEYLNLLFKHSFAAAFLHPKR